MKNDSFKEKVLGAIEEQKITPKQRWEFLVREYGIWVVGFLAFALSGLALGVSFHLIRNADWDIHHELGASGFMTFWAAMPYLWLILLIAFVVAADYAVRKSKRGYRFSMIQVVVASVIISIGIGSLLYATGVAEKTDDTLTRRVPQYARYTHPQARLWAQPDEGRLVGIIVHVEDNTHFFLLDIRGEEWEVEYEPNQSTEEVVTPDQRVKLLGEKLGPLQFFATHIFPAIRKPSPLAFPLDLKKEGKRLPPASFPLQSTPKAAQ